jgi:hypothetical protein
MKTSGIRIAVFAVLAVALAGCPKTPGGDDGGGDGGGGADAGVGGGSGAAARAWCEAYAGAYCDYLIGCGVVAPTGRAACLGALTIEACRDVEAVALGARTFDVQKAQACLAAAWAQPADCLGSPDDSACDDIFKPSAQRGQRCVRSGDCLESTDVCIGPPCGSVCLASGGLNQPCGGGCNEGLWCSDDGAVCQAPLPLGSSCSDDSFYSPQCDTQGRCDGTTCVALPSDGAPCRNDFHRPCSSGHYCDAAQSCRAHLPLGQSCDHPDACGPQASCRFANGQYICVARVGPGGPCEQEGDCQQGLRCASGQCAPRATEGQACESSAACAQGLSCDALLLTCQTYEYSAAGGPCTNSTKQCIGITQCVGLVEDPNGGAGTPGTCTERTAGSPCQGSWECPQPGYCDLSSAAGSCQPSGLGTPCDGYNCRPEHYCGPSSTCEARLAAGASCVSSNACLPPDACVGAQGSKICGPRGAEGEPCTSTSGCLFPFDCTGQICVPAGGQGQPCYQKTYCVQGACLSPDASSERTCGPLAQSGEACSTQYDCASRRCENGVCAAICT